MVAKFTLRYQAEGQRVLRRLIRKNRSVLYRVGGYGRKVMRTMIKIRNDVSPPGQPPHAHVPSGQGMKRTYFEVDMNNLSVVMGHKKNVGRARVLGAGATVLVTSPCPVPQLLNEGGPAAILITRGGKSRIIPRRYRARPFRDKAEQAIYAFALNTLAKEVL